MSDLGRVRSASPVSPKTAPLPLISPRLSPFISMIAANSIPGPNLSSHSTAFPFPEQQPSPSSSSSGFNDTRVTTPASTYITYMLTQANTMCRPSSTSSAASGLGAGVGSGTITASVRALMPNHPACAEALLLAKSSLPPSILYHSFRVFLYAQAFMRIFQDDPEEQLPPPHPSVFAATTAAASGPSGRRNFSGASLRTTPSSGSLKSPTSTSHPSPSLSLSATSGTLVNGSEQDPQDNDRDLTLPLPAFGLGLGIGTAISEPPPSHSPRQVAPPAAFPDYILFVGCILHDVGVAAQYDAIPERFEVVGADVAVRILRSHLSPPSSSSSSHTHSPSQPSFPLPNRIQNTTYLANQALQSQQIKDLWLALSLHTSPGIAERIGGVVRAIRLAVRADFGSYPLPPAEMFGGDLGALNVVKWGLPRLEIEKELGDAVVRQALAERRKAPASSWPGDLVRARDEDPNWEGVNKGF